MNRKKFKEKVEKQITKDWNFLKSLELDISFTKTKHAENRQTRHTSRITDEEIKNTIEEVSSVLKKNILNNDINPGDELVIRDQVYNLNLVTKLRKKSTSCYDLLIETVMLSCDFDVNPDQEVIDIFNS